MEGNNWRYGNLSLTLHVWLNSYTHLVFTGFGMDSSKGVSLAHRAGASGTPSTAKEGPPFLPPTNPEEKVT